jgi:alkylation response protein AidB-like acyl-CoA dehydrogenase
VSLTRPADVWHPVWDAVLGCALPLIMAPYVGIADAAVATALELVNGRQDAHIVQLAGEMLTAHVTGADAVDAMFAASDDLTFANNVDNSSLTLCRKAVAADALIRTVRLAVELVGGIGYTRARPLERLYRDVHGCLFHPLPRAKQVIFCGRVALGLSPV